MELEDRKEVTPFISLVHVFSLCGLWGPRSTAGIWETWLTKGVIADADKHMVCGLTEQSLQSEMQMSIKLTPFPSINSQTPLSAIYSHPAAMLLH